MLTEEQATQIIKSAFLDGEIKAFIDYNGVYLFQVFSPDPLEGDQDPFFSVNQTTGELRDFSVMTDGDINEITEKFLAKEAGG